MDNVCIKGERIFATQGFMLALNARAHAKMAHRSLNDFGILWMLRMKKKG
jgi:hypothetical protein